MGYALFFLILFGVALGFFEASVVVYLRALVYPGAPLFPMKTMPLSILTVELLREFFSIVLIWSAAVLAGRTRALKFAAFLILFGVWDVFYYVFLRLLIHWPATWTDWDILFLIPVPWVAPWTAPALCAATLVVFGYGMYKLWSKGYPMPIAREDILVGAVASVPIMISFFWETSTVLHGGVPAHYPWALLFLGLALAWAWALLRYRKYTRFKN
jgi:hypothetical protein